MVETNISVIKRDPNFNPETFFRKDLNKTDPHKPNTLPVPVSPKPLLFIEDTIGPAEDPEESRDEVLREKREKNTRAAIEALHTEHKNHPIAKKVTLPFSYDTLAPADEEDDLAKEILAYLKPRQSSVIETTRQAAKADTIVAAQPKPFLTKTPQESKYRKSSSTSSSQNGQLKLGPRPMLEAPSAINDEQEEFLNQFLKGPEKKKKKGNNPPITTNHELSHIVRDSDSNIDTRMFAGFGEQRELGHELSHLSLDEVALSTKQKKSMQEMIEFYQKKIIERKKNIKWLNWTGTGLSFLSMFISAGLLAAMVATGGVSAIFSAFALAVGLGSNIINIGNGIIKLYTQNLIGKSIVMQQLRAEQHERGNAFLRECSLLNTRLHYYWQMSSDLLERKNKAQKTVQDL